MDNIDNEEKFILWSRNDTPTQTWIKGQVKVEHPEKIQVM